MFSKYNKALRDVGDKLSSQETRVDDVPYRTTIHLISSGLIKLGRIQPAKVLYRGIQQGRLLPKQLSDMSALPNMRMILICPGLSFLEEDPVYRVRGGVEFAFLSCSEKRHVALQYGCNGFVFEMHTGLVSRGANLSWLSYYPEESEVCFPPCTALQLVRKDRMYQGAVVLTVQVVCAQTVNLFNSPPPSCLDLTQTFASSVFESSSCYDRDIRPSSTRCGCRAVSIADRGR